MDGLSDDVTRRQTKIDDLQELVYDEKSETK